MNSASIEVKDINEKLLLLYGKHISCDQQLFRVVWSDDQREKRFGTFNVFAGDIFLREETGIREVEKYWYLENQWVVERLHINYHKDVFEGVYIYEPLWAFPKGLPVKWEAIDLCVKKALKMVPADSERSVPKTEKEAIYQDNEKKAEEVKETRKALDEISDPTELELRLKDGDAVSMTGKRLE